jgi:DNA-directed RNA polymerase subunit RPC12/RpoP
VFYTKKDKPRENEEKYYCSVCGAEISEEDYEDYDGMCTFPRLEILIFRENVGEKILPH